MNTYVVLKQLHVGTVHLSLALFIVRGLLMLRDSAWLHHKVVRVLPHMVDSVLLITAILLTLLIDQYPFLQTWLTVKVLLLIAYIVLGTIALKRGKTKTVRTSAFLGALLLFGFIYSVARTHQPFGLFALFTADGHPC